MTITPAIDLDKIKHLRGDEGGFFQFEVELGDMDVKIINGVVTAVGTKPDVINVTNYFEESIKAYSFDETVDALITIAKQEGAVVDGIFYGDGEESEDFWALVVENNTHRTEPGQVVYAHSIAEQKAIGWAAAHDAICILNTPGCHINPFGSP